MRETFIKITKRNNISRTDFVKLIEDPATHVRFLRNKIIIETNDSLSDLLDEIEQLSTDIYHVDMLANTTAYVYFYSGSDAAQFRR